MNRRALLIAALAALPALHTSGATAQSNYYAGKTITIVVGYKTGGGYDSVARLLARHLPKYIPGSPNIVVQNMPGANSMIAANHVYNVAKPDGLTIGTFNRNLPIAQLTKVQGVKFDMTKFAWIGSAANEATILAIRAGLPYKSFAELKNAKEPVIDRGLVRPIIRARAVEPGIEKLPVDEDLAPNPRAKAIMALRSAPEIIGRPFVMTPGTSDAVLKTLREAFAKAIEDPQLKAEAKKAKMDLNYVSADEALKVMKEVLSQPKDIVDEFSKYIKFGE